MIDTARVLREARKRAGLTQRELAARVGMTQPAVARIERGTVVPRVDTLDRLLAACGEGLYAEARPGIGVDRTVMRSLLKQTYRSRLDQSVAWAKGLDELRSKRKGAPA